MKINRTENETPEEQWTVINEYGKNVGWWPTYEEAERNCHGVCRVEKIDAITARQCAVVLDGVIIGEGADAYAAWERAVAEGKTSGSNRDESVIEIEIHKNQDGEPYYSQFRGENTIYSFTLGFEDIWTQGDQDALDSGSTPAKY